MQYCISQQFSAHCILYLLPGAATIDRMEEAIFAQDPAGRGVDKAHHGEFAQADVGRELLPALSAVAGPVKAAIVSTDGPCIARTLDIEAGWICLEAGQSLWIRHPRAVP